MKARRNIIIAISAIVVFAAIIGFFITLDVSPQIAYARLFIDAGLVIGLVAVVMAFYREKVLATEGILQVLRSLKAGQYKARVNLLELGPLNEVGDVINELAVVLEDDRLRQENIKRNLREELLPGLKQQKDILNFEHSLHPELGPVNSLPVADFEKPFKEPYGFRDMVPVPMVKNLSIASSETSLNNTLISSNPPKKDSFEDEEMVNIESFCEEQDLGELYERFVTAQKSFDIEQIEYTLFLKTIEKTKEELISSYKCSGILFDIVKEANQVALQPKIVR